MTEPIKCPDDEGVTLQQFRSPLIGLTYRMLGSALDAGDLVAEAYLHWRSAPRDSARSPKDYLAAAVAKLSTDALNRGRARREPYAGPRWPEPSRADQSGPAEACEISDSLSLAFVVTPKDRSRAQRAVFLLPGLF